MECQVRRVYYCIVVLLFIVLLYYGIMVLLYYCIIDQRFISDNTNTIPALFYVLYFFLPVFLVRVRSKRHVWVYQIYLIAVQARFCRSNHLIPVTKNNLKCVVKVIYKLLNYVYVTTLIIVRLQCIVSDVLVFFL